MDDNLCNINSVTDIFSGSGVVASAFKQKGYQVNTNDLLYFSYVLNRGTVCLNYIPSFKGLVAEPIDYLISLQIENTNYDLKDCFIYQNYSPNEDCNRMYFQNNNAIKIDIIRKTIEQWYVEQNINEDEYFYLLACLINAVPYVSNITGVYGAYLKHWDKRTYKDLFLKHSNIIESEQKCVAYNLDANEYAGSIYSDLTYIDPPYNSRQYLPNYHVLETIARYDNPKISGVTGLREYGDQKSRYCQRANVANAFAELLEKLDTKYILISYNNEGLLSTDELSDIVISAGIKSTFKLYEFDYRRYKSKIPNNEKGLKEQLYFIRKK